MKETCLGIIVIIKYLWNEIPRDSSILVFDSFWYFVFLPSSHRNTFIFPNDSSIHFNVNNECNKGFDCPLKTSAPDLCLTKTIAHQEIHNSTIKIMPVSTAQLFFEKKSCETLTFLLINAWVIFKKHKYSGF